MTLKNVSFGLNSMTPYNTSVLLNYIPPPNVKLQPWLWNVSFGSIIMTPCNPLFPPMCFSIVLAHMTWGHPIQNYLSTTGDSTDDQSWLNDVWIAIFSRDCCKYFKPVVKLCIHTLSNGCPHLVWASPFLYFYLGTNAVSPVGMLCVQPSSVIVACPHLAYCDSHVLNQR